MSRFETLKWLFCLAGVLLAAPTLNAQSDTSLLLRAERLSEKDIRLFDKSKVSELVQSVSGVPEKPLDLPFSTWVITSEDILRYGFVTLTDVLKAAPGIRVSQPGNAVEGETFMMRGLSGNQYVKILINNVPVKPSMALGMPIAAQLPIRQAERIEVLYGAAGGMMYGNEACAGVVNIIIKETERPIFTQADLGFGTKGFNSLDLTFGGKLFKDRNILRFSLYGSSTVRSSTDVFWDRDVYNSDNYRISNLLHSDYSYSDNYVEESKEDSTYTRTSPIPHESRMFGMQLAWRGVQFSYHRMGRSDASALGMSPLAVSYTSTGDLMKDRIDTYALKFWKKKERFYFNSTFSYESYRVSNTSSSRYIFDKIAAQRYLSSDASSLTGGDRLLFLNGINWLYTSGQRYSFGRNSDFRSNTDLRFQLWNKFWLNVGADLGVFLGRPMTTHLFFPADENLFTYGNGPGPFSIDYFARGYGNLYAGLDWQSNRFRVMAGVGHTLAYDRYNPRLAMLYKIDSSSCVFANGAQAVKLFHQYQQQNTFQSYGDNVYSGIYPLNDAANFENERFRSAELGYRRQKSEFTLFVQESHYLLRDGYYQTIGENSIAGFFSGPDLSQRLWGAQTRLVLEATETIAGKNRHERVVSWRGEFFAQYARGKEWFGYGLTPTDEVRNYPRWITQFRSSGRTGRLQMMVSSNRQTSVMSKVVPFSELWQRTNIREKYPTFRTWDLMLRFYLNKNFVLYFNTLNVFNRESYGIDASGSPDDALAPLQQRRLVRFGVNYNMN